jgi:biopolymer transport protein ExbD
MNIFTRIDINSDGLPSPINSSPAVARQSGSSTPDENGTNIPPSETNSIVRATHFNSKNPEEVFTMGHDERQQPNSSGTLVAVLGVGLVLAILAIIAVAAVGLYWVGARTQQTQATRAIVMEERAIAELHRAEAEEQRAIAVSQLEHSRVAETPDPRLNFELNLDREGNASKDGERLGLDELKAEIAKLKEETNNVFRVRINADPDCPIKLVVPVLDVLDEVGDIDYRIVSSTELDFSVGESKTDE